MRSSTQSNLGFEVHEKLVLPTHKDTVMTKHMFGRWQVTNTIYDGPKYIKKRKILIRNKTP
jgi:hypothetical protein